MDDKEKLDMLLEAVDSYIKSTGQDTAIAIKAMIDASKACREPEKPKVICINLCARDGLYVCSKGSGTPYIERTDEVRGRLAKTGGVNLPKVFDIIMDEETPDTMKCSLVESCIAAAAVEVDDD